MAVPYDFNTTVNQIFDPDYLHNTVVLNQTFINPQQAATPEIVWIIIAAAALLFLYACLKEPIRNDGEVNPNRVAFSLVALVLCAYTAFSSLTIDVIDGVAGGAFGFMNTSGVGPSLTTQDFHHLYASSIHSLYNQPGVSIIFIVFSFIALANLIYVITRQDIILPDNEVRGQKGFKTKAEGSRRGGGDEE